jgi:anti-sigma regulatory factor (Ser/Thr protein kinase)
VIVASELATNAIRHGGGSGRLRLWRTDDQLVCEVRDSGAGIADPGIGAKPVGPTAMGGRGIWICRTLSDSLTIEAGKPGATVTASITL